MKLAFNNSHLKNCLFIIAFAWLAAIIWHYGPSLVIAHHTPLQEPQKRIAVILTLALAWLAKMILYRPSKPTDPEALNLIQMQQLLRGHFLGAIRFLKKTIINKHGHPTPLNKLTWHLLIGPPGSGKTSLLANSNINFILSKQYKNEDHEKSICSSTVCDWWVTQDLVLVDVPGSYAFSPMQNTFSDSPDESIESFGKEAATKPHLYHALWRNFLSLLIKHKQKHNIGSMIIALSLPELIKQPRYQQTLWFQEIKQRLNECWGKFGKLPIYLIITKCDLLPGFSEFFNGIGSDELTQSWGIPLTALKEHENLQDAFVTRFNALIKRLNKQLIWRLHQERDSQARLLIKEFPLQLEYIKETLNHLIKILLSANLHLKMEGVYLTSAIQENTFATATTLFHHDVPSGLQIINPSPFISRAYFVKHIISYLLPHISHRLNPQLRLRHTRLSKAAYSIGLASVLLGAMWMGRDFHHSLYQVSTVQHSLGQYQLYLQQNKQQAFSIASAHNALSLLNALEVTAQPVHHFSLLQKLENFYSSKPQQAAINIYHRALQTILLPFIRNELEKYLQSAEDKNPEQVYSALKAYLMLKDQPTGGYNDAQCQFVINTLLKISPSLKKELFSNSFILHIKNALQIKQENNLDQELTTYARKFLNAIPNNELGYILLKSYDENSKEVEINLGTNIGTPPTLISKGTATLVPYMYTASAYSKIIKTQIYSAAKQALTGNSVLGNKPLPVDSLVPVSPAINSLAEELQKNYLSHYVDIWESLTDNISLNTPKNLAEVDAMILNLISGHSPLLQLLQTIHINTNIEPVLANSFRLQALNTLFSQTQTKQKDSLYQIFVDLRELYLQLHHKSPETATLSEDTMTRIHAMADHYPEPIKNWLQTLVTLTRNQLHIDANANTTAKATDVKQRAPENTPLVILKQPANVSSEKKADSLNTAIIEQQAKLASQSIEPELTAPKHKALSKKDVPEKKEVIRDGKPSHYLSLPGKEYVQVVSKKSTQ